MSKKAKQPVQAQAQAPESERERYVEKGRIEVLPREKFQTTAAEFEALALASFLVWARRTLTVEAVKAADPSLDDAAARFYALAEHSTEFTVGKKVAQSLAKALKEAFVDGRSWDMSPAADIASRARGHESLFAAMANACGYVRQAAPIVESSEAPTGVRGEAAVNYNLAADRARLRVTKEEVRLGARHDRFNAGEELSL